MIDKNYRFPSTIAKIFILAATLLALLVVFIEKPSAKASNHGDFHVTDSYILLYEEGNDYITVSEKLTIEGFNDNYRLPAGTSQQFIIHDFLLNSMPEERQFKLDTLRVLDKQGQEIDVDVTSVDSGLQFTIVTKEDVTSDQSFEVTIEFATHDLVNRNGNIINFYIPGIPIDTELTTVNRSNGLTFTYEYDAQLSIPDKLPSATYISPKEIDTETIDNSRIFHFDTEDRLGETGWIQIGTEQYYYFRMLQNTPKTDTLIPRGVSDYSEYLSTNIYQLPLPKEYGETNQEVYFSNISPEPTRIDTDEEGNLIGYFEVPANQSTQIEIEGYIKLSSETQNSFPEVPLTQYLQTVQSSPALQRYTVAERYWESDSEAVMGVAKDLKLGKSTLHELIKADYDYIIRAFDYSYEKVEGENKRLGALAALNGAETVCMEYSDAMIAILRAQGVPAKAAVGYGNDPTGAENQIGSDEASKQNIAHQWVQVWVPEYGWLSVDPTWGESEREYIGGNLDHILWYTIGDSDQDYIGTALSSADNITTESFENYTLYLQALPEGSLPDITELQSISDLVERYNKVNSDQFSDYLKTTPLGKSIVVVAPICTILLFSFLLISVFTRFLKRRSKVNSPESGDIG